MTAIWNAIDKLTGLLRTRRPPGSKSSVCFTALFTACLSGVLGTAPSQVALARNRELPPGLQAVPQVSDGPHRNRFTVTDANDIRFTRLTSSEKLSQTRVGQIAQDDQGFLWFGTQYGLNRYDGYEFKVFTPDPARSSSIGGVYIHTVFKDHRGALWVGGEGFLDRFDSATETFKHYRITAHDRSGGVDVIVVHISEETTGMLWLATGQGLFRLDPATGVVAHFVHDANNPFSLSSNDIKSSGEDRKGTFWVCSAAGLDAFDRRTGKVTLRVPMVELRELSFLEDREGVFWIYHASGNGLEILDRATRRLTHVVLSEHNVHRSLPAGIYAALEDRAGTLWFGTGGGGLLKFDRSGHRFIRYRSYPSDAQSIAGNNVVALFDDREGNVWIALHGAPLSLFTSRDPPFQKIPRDPNPRYAGSGPLVNAIYEDTHGTLWISYLGVLTGLDRRTARYSSYPVGSAGLTADVVTIAGDPDGTLWLGTVGAGLAHFDPRSGWFRYYRHDPANRTSLSGDVVARLLIDHAGVLWAATWNGLNRFDRATGRFSVYRADTENRTLYSDLAEDRDGSLWLGGISGVQHFDPATQTFTVYSHDASQPSSISSDHVNSVAIGQSDTIWAGTQYGLNRLDRRTGSFTTYHPRDGLPGDVISCLREDRSGDLWISSNKGLSRFSAAAKTFTNYSTGDGLPGADLTGWGTCFESPQGEMFFGGFGGGTGFRPERVTETSYSPPVVLTSFELSGIPVQVGPGSPLTRAINYAKDITLPYDNRNFSVEFSALSFGSPSTNRYRYKLEGFDSQWHEAGSDRRLVSYAALAPGTYHLFVQGATVRGPWHEPSTSLLIAILPPWWSTWWFRTLIAALLLALGFATYRRRARQLVLNFAIRLDERVAERTRIAQDLHDSMLQGFQALIIHLQAIRDMLPGRPTEAARELELALDRGDRSIEEGRDAVRGLRSGSLADPDLVESLTALNRELSAHSRREAPPACRIIVEGQARILNPAIRDEVYRIAREALRNAYQHARARNLEVEIGYDNREFSVRVRDDGKGVDLQVLAQGRRTGHWGLPGMIERAQGLGGKLNIWSQSGAGTEIELRIPAGAAYRSGHIRSSKNNSSNETLQ
jgi:signal transduction histidine kinase/ligand-binding sensor domain-containing protein